MDEPPSPLLKSRIPRKTKLVDPDKLHKRSWENAIQDAHCPLQKGIICYGRNDTIFEYNIHSSGKHEPRIIVPKHPSRLIKYISFVPIKDNRILLFAKYSDIGTGSFSPKYLHLSIHEIRSDHRVGPALWSFHGSIDGYLNNLDLRVIKSTENALGITFWVQFDDHWKVFDISTTETDASKNFPLIESGRIGFDPKFKLRSLYDKSPFILSPEGRILLNVDWEEYRYNETVDVHYLDLGATNFSFVTRMSIPHPTVRKSGIHVPQLAFSADGSKFAMGMPHHDGGVSVWNIQSKVPLQTFTEVPRQPKEIFRSQRFIQFSSGNLGKELLLFVEHDRASDLVIIHVIDAMSFETEEKLSFRSDGSLVGALFFDPSGGTLYAELDGTIYEWDLRKKEPGPEWWIGEE